MTFEDVIGQPQVTETLRRQVESGRLSHAYLFTGSRGTGKTTCAKLLAKAVNCEHPRGGEPCNECAYCRGVNDGSLSDVTEIDAASNNGVENIRSLREQTVFTPAEARRRVYIIDECHMLTPGAFNALLKTLEEPPEHVLFILATTDLQRIPATILSRCQRFTFRRLLPQDIALHLRRIALAENIPLTDSGSLLLARLAEGGMRDAISMLDQVSSAGYPEIGEDEIFSALGLAGYGDSVEAVRAIAACDAHSALGVLARVYEAGKDIPAFLGELSRLLRDLVVLRSTGDFSLASGSYRTDELTSIDMDPARLRLALDTVSDTLLRLQRSIDRRLDAELCLLRLCDPSLSSLTTTPATLTSFEERLCALERAFRSGARPAVTPAVTPAAVPAPTQTTASAPKTEPAQPGESETSETSAAAAATEGASATTGTPGALDEQTWRAILDVVSAQLSKPDLLQLKRLPVPSLSGDVLTLDTREAFVHAQLSRGDIAPALGRAAGEVLGTPVTVRLSAPASEEENRMKRLVDKFSKFDNFEII